MKNYLKYLLGTTAKSTNKENNMGEMADAIIDGECCQVCGQYFEEEQGYPCTCEECGGDTKLAC